MARIALVLMAALSLEPAVAAGSALTNTEIFAVQAGVKHQLKDPGSAKFGRISASANRQRGSAIICGFVNAKNSFGGYTGMKPFIGILAGPPGSSKYAFVAMDIGDKPDVVMEMCRQEGIEGF